MQRFFFISEYIAFDENIAAFLLYFECSVEHLLTPFMGQLRHHPFLSFYFILSPFFLSAWLLLAPTCCFVCKFPVEKGDIPLVTITLSENERLLVELFLKTKLKSFVCSSSHRVYCHLFTECFHSRHLRKRSTYLIIKLTVADLLVATVAGPSIIFQPDNLETVQGLEQHLSWQSLTYFTLQRHF